MSSFTPPVFSLNTQHDDHKAGLCAYLDTQPVTRQGLPVCGARVSCYRDGTYFTVTDISPLVRSSGTISPAGQDNFHQDTLRTFRQATKDLRNTKAVKRLHDALPVDKQMSRAQYDMQFFVFPTFTLYAPMAPEQYLHIPSHHTPEQDKARVGFGGLLSVVLDRFMSSHDLMAQLHHRDAYSPLVQEAGAWILRMTGLNAGAPDWHALKPL